MLSTTSPRSPSGLVSPLITASMILAMTLTATLCAFPSPPQAAKPDPWTPQQLIQPVDFAHELAAAKSTDRPTILYVGFRTLFEGGHIPGASFHGTASTEQGLADLKTWAGSLPRSANLVIYCGCCPFDRCPNVRPAFTALRDMGFTHLRLLVLPKNFAADWVDQGFPIEKGL